jgi:ankyrin repeat protein
MNKTEHIKVGELEIPLTYWEMDEQDKNDLCLTIMDSMLIILDKHLNEGLNRIDVLDKMLESSIMVNTQTEEYEICEVMTRIRKLINE